MKRFRKASGITVMVVGLMLFIGLAFAFGADHQAASAAAGSSMGMALFFVGTSALTGQHHTDMWNNLGYTASSTRYKVACYGSGGAISAATTAYTATQELANSTNYAAGGTTVVSTLDNANRRMTFTDKVINTAAGETIGPIYYALIYDTSNSNHTVAFLDYSSAPISGSGSGGSVTLDFGAITIALTVA